MFQIHGRYGFHFVLYLKYIVRSRHKPSNCLKYRSLSSASQMHGQLSSLGFSFSVSSSLSFSLSQMLPGRARIHFLVDNHAAPILGLHAVRGVSRQPSVAEQFIQKASCRVGPKPLPGRIIPLASGRCSMLSTVNHITSFCYPYHCLKVQRNKGTNSSLSELVVRNDCRGCK